MYYVLYNFKVTLFCFDTVKILLLDNKTDSDNFFGKYNKQHYDWNYWLTILSSCCTSQSHFLSFSPHGNYLLCSFEFIFLLHFTLDEQPTKVH